MKFLFYCIWALTSNPPQLIGLHLNLHERIKNPKLKYLPTIVLCILYFVFALIFTTENTVMRICFAVSFFVYALVGFTDKIATKLIVSSLLTVLSILVDLIVELPVYLYKGKPYGPSDYSVETIITCVLFFLLFSTAVLVFTRLNKHNDKIVDKTSYLFFLVPFSNVLFLLAVTWEFNDPLFWNAWRTTLFASGLTVMLISVFLLYRAMRENYKAKQTLTKLAQYEYNQKLSESYFENVTQSAQMLMKYKHDFNNMITTALHMVSSEDVSVKQEGVKLLEQIRDKNTATVIPVYCKNAVVNTILFDKSAKAQTQGVDFSFDLNLPEKLDLELTDLCSIFTNLIDNGLSSAELSEDNRLELKAWCDMGYMFVRTKNYPDDDAPLPQESENKAAFDISNLSAHGYGLSILRDIAEKYNGSFEIKQESSSIEVLCCINLEQADTTETSNKKTAL